jgi:hypothetical protein
MTTHRMMLRIHELRERLAKVAVAEQLTVLRAAQRDLAQREAQVQAAKDALSAEQEKRNAKQVTSSDDLLLTDSHIRSLIEAGKAAEKARVEASHAVDREMAAYQKLMHEYLRLQERAKLSAKRAREAEIVIELSHETNEEEALLEVFNQSANATALQTI